MKTKLMILCAVILILFLWAFTSVYPDWLWFQNLDFTSVFLTTMLSKFGFGFLVWFFLIIILFINLYIAQKAKPLKTGDQPFGDGDNIIAQYGISNNTINIFLLLFILVASFVIATKGSAQWDMVLRFLYQEPFGAKDPIFQKDIGFYVFSLPFYVFIREGLLVLFLFAAILTIIWYFKDGALQVIDELAQTDGNPISLPKINISPSAKKHLIILGGIMVLLIAWGYRLKIYMVLYSTQGPAFGASFTDINIKIFGYYSLIILSLAMAVILFVNAKKPKAKLILICGGVWIGGIALFGTLLPMTVQKFIVKPNELAKESDFIAHNIEYTRSAYDLNKIKEVDFAVNDNLSSADLEKEKTTIQNIRIWDERPLLQTYRQLQAIRLYYDFNNVDVDRYLIDNQYRQIMLAARELVVDQLPPQAKTWVNRHLIYTHGYGLAASPVNEVTEEGLPQLFIKDLPPVIDIGLDIDRPEIYYGEKTDEYVFVKTEAKEFDYPKGDKNVYATYEGKGGVPIKSFLRRLLYAFEFLDPQILFTSYINSDSRIMYNRRIGQRVRALAPFLEYDGDPYLVISDGKLCWMLDAYTITSMYPYSHRSLKRFKNKSLNYIRNSVKVTIDAYNGNITFYQIDQDDPIAKTYARIFPKLFKPFDDMPADLKKHIRYPRDLFQIQIDVYKKYHMQDIQVFYNQEDLWQLPDELYSDSRQEMKPYYIIIKLPESDKEEFLLMIPFTPSRKDNMIGWLAARSDLPNYGNLFAYKLPKDKLVYGPMQIEARVDQQTEISRELSLWGQRGSRVIRGNLLAIPVSGAFIYVEPIYLEARQEQEEQPQPTQQKRSLRPQAKTASPMGKTTKQTTSSLPELKRVIASFSNRVVMEENLDKALKSILGKEAFMKATSAPLDDQEQIEIPDLGKRALEHYNRAKAFLQRSDWAGYGEELDKLEAILKALAAKNEK